MKYILILITFMFMNGCIKQKDNPKTSSTNIENVFNESMQNVISEIVTLKKETKRDIELFCLVVLSDIDSTNECYVYSTLSLAIDTVLIIGYTYFEDEVIACYILDNSCNSEGLIRVENLLYDKDEIRKIFFTNYPFPIILGRNPSRTYKVINPDSLVLVN